MSLQRTRGKLAHQLYGDRMPELDAVGAGGLLLFL